MVLSGEVTRDGAVVAPGHVDSNVPVFGSWRRFDNEVDGTNVTEVEEAQAAVLLTLAGSTRTPTSATSMPAATSLATSLLTAGAGAVQAGDRAGGPGVNVGDGSRPTSGDILDLYVTRG